MLIPALILQLLVENAVKHNSMSTTSPLMIEVMADCNCINVKNNIDRRDVAEKSTVIGLENISKCIAYATNRRVEIEESAHFFQ